MRISLEYVSSQPFEVVGNGREIRLNCPNCDDTTKHLYVNNDRSCWYCFKCGKGGKLEFTKRLEPDVGMFDEAKFMPHVRNMLANKKHMATYDGTIERVKSLPANFKINPGANAIHAPYDYLRSRGVTTNEILRYDIRASMEKDGPYKNSVIFPVHIAVAHGLSSELELQYFVCRKYDNSKPKYVNAPWPKGDTLFESLSMPRSNIPFGRVIVEGIFDAIAVARIGYTGIALLGKTATPQQLKRLAEKLYGAPNCLVYLDNDALTHAVQLKLQLSALGINTQLVRQDKDAADLYMENPKALERALLYALKHS